MGTADVSTFAIHLQGNNASMYVRPLLFASGQMLGLAPLASEYTFFVTVLPAGGYFGKGSEVGVKAACYTSSVKEGEVWKIHNTVDGS